MITSVGLPINLEMEAVTMGFAFKSNFILPMNGSDFWAILSQPFDVHSTPITSFKRSIEDNDGDEIGFDNEENEKFERHQVKAEVVVESGTDRNDNDFDDDISDLDNKFASTRWLVYKGFAEIAERYRLFV